MKILSITAGAAGMYCGSCLRDNALAAELIAQGHDVTLQPLYTPTLTDETNVSRDRVFFGGISVYLQQYSAIFRKTPWLLDKLWDSPAVIRAVSRRSIATSPRLLGELTVSMLRGENGHQSKEFRKLVRWLQSESPPDIVNLPNSLLIGLALPLRKALNRPVCCTLQGEDLFLEGLSEPYRSEALGLIRGSIEHVDAFLAVSQYYADFMCRYLGIPESKMNVVPLGINLSGYPAAPHRQPDHFTIGYFARVAPEKGLHLLCDAYRRLRHSGRLPLSALEVAGYLAREHHQYLHGIERQMTEWGLSQEFHYRGVLDRRQKIDYLRSLDVLSVPSTYDEPKGIFLLEAMACQVPVVQPRRGAFPEILAKTSGGILVEPDDPESLAEGLHQLWENQPLREELGRKAAQGVHQHYSVARMAQSALAVYGSLGTAAAPSRPL